jgi:hypothetical protein
MGVTGIDRVLLVNVGRVGSSVVRRAKTTTGKTNKNNRGAKVVSMLANRRAAMKVAFAA